MQPTPDYSVNKKSGSMHYSLKVRCFLKILSDLVGSMFFLHVHQIAHKQQKIHLKSESFDYFLSFLQILKCCPPPKSTKYEGEMLNLDPNIDITYLTPD